MSRGLCAVVSLPGHVLCVAEMCARDSAPLAGLCITGLVRTCSSSPRLSSTLWGLCALVSSHCSHSLSWGLFVLLLAVPGGMCALPKFICLPCRHPSPTLCAGCLSAVTLGFLGPPSVLQGLCALAGFVRRATLGSPSRRLFGATGHELLTG